MWLQHLFDLFQMHHFPATALFLFLFFLFFTYTRVPIKSSPLVEHKVCKLCAMWRELSPCLCLQSMARALHTAWDSNSRTMRLWGVFFRAGNWLDGCLTRQSLNKMIFVAARFMTSGANQLANPFSLMFQMINLPNKSGKKHNHDTDHMQKK